MSGGRGEYLAERMIEENIDISSDYTSKGISLGHMARLSVQIVISNTNAVGTISFECSNNNSDWLTLAYIDGSTNDKDVSYSVISGTDINQMWDWDNLGCGYVRVKYEATSGNGTMGIWVIRKRI